MTPIDRFERHLPMALTDLAAPRTPDYLTDILGRTARTRQRPAWASIERWLPVQLATSRVPVTRMPWRQLGVLALIALLLAAMLALYVGSQQRRLPPPFGQADNGSIAFSSKGDIHVADPRSGTTSVLVGGPETDMDPTYSLDGTRLLFGRQLEGNPTKVLLFVIRSDGTGLTQLTKEPLRDADSWSFSPDGRSIVAFASGDAGHAIVIVPSDGSDQPTFFPVIATYNDGAPQYRPDGAEIMFIGQEPGRAYRGVYALVTATGEVRTVIAPMPTIDIHSASWSPDGKHVAYGTWDPLTATARTHVVGADGTGDVAVDTKPESIADAGVTWSNDATRLIVTRFYREDGPLPPRDVILPIDRSSTGIEIDCPPGAPVDNCGANWTWSPDDSVLLTSFTTSAGTTSHLMADPVTGRIRVAQWSGDGQPTWQRLAR
jgi:Tol biopolymer transport system component